MLWVPGSILGDAGHAWGPTDPPFHLINVGPAPGPSAINPLPGLATGPSLLYPWPYPPIVCTLYNVYKCNEYYHASKPVE